MKNRLLESLPSSEQAWMASFFLDRTFEKGSVLQEAGQPVDQVYFPRSGLVTLLGVLPGGAQIDTAMVGPEGAIGAAAGIGMQKAFGRAMVQIPGRFAQISAVRLAEWASRSKAVRDMILRYNEELIAQIQRHAHSECQFGLRAAVECVGIVGHQCVCGTRWCPGEGVSSLRQPRRGCLHALIAGPIRLGQSITGVSPPSVPPKTSPQPR